MERRCENRLRGLSSESLTAEVMTCDHEYFGSHAGIPVELSIKLVWSD